MKVTSDLHIGDSNMAKLWGFESKEAAADYMLGIWNRDVGDEDVWVLGDFIVKASWVSIVDRMAGRIHLIRGNHDLESIDRLNSSKVEVHGWVHLLRASSIGIEGEDFDIILTHRYVPQPGVVLHGHSHGQGRGDVGIMTWDRVLDIRDAIRWAKDE